MLFQIDKIAEEKKRHNLTDEEYNSLPSYISIYAEQGDNIPNSLIKEWRKDFPRQETASDSTRIEIIGAKGERTGEFVSFSKKDPVERRAQRRLEIANTERIAKGQADQPKDPSKEQDITRLSSEISTLSSTAKRLAEQDIGFEAIEGVITTKQDSIRLLSDQLKAEKIVTDHKSLLSGKSKLTAQEKNRFSVSMANVERALRSGAEISVIRELIQDNWGMTLEDFNTIYKSNK